LVSVLPCGEKAKKADGWDVEKRGFLLVSNKRKTEDRCLYMLKSENEGSGIFISKHPPDPFFTAVSSDTQVYFEICNQKRR